MRIIFRIMNFKTKYLFLFYINKGAIFTHVINNKTTTFYFKMKSLITTKILTCQFEELSITFESV